MATDFVRFKDEASGDYYYHCFQTEATLWDEPERWREPTKDELVGDGDEDDEDDVDPNKNIINKIINDTTKEEKADNTQATGEADDKEGKEDEDIEIWEKCTEPTSGDHYYFNPKTEVTQWEYPTHSLNIRVVPVSENKVSSTSEKEDKVEATVESLSEENTQETEYDDWQQCTEVGTGQHYYFNPKTQITQWELPMGKNTRIIPISESNIIQTEVVTPLVQSRIDPRNAFATAIAQGKTPAEAATIAATVAKGPNVKQHTVPNIKVYNPNVGGDAAAAAAWALTSNATVKDTNSVASNGWEQCVDPDSKRLYYYNTLTQERQWEPPADHIASILPSATDRYIYIYICIERNGIYYHYSICVLILLLGYIGRSGVITLHKLHSLKIEDTQELGGI